jgi:hypothetical protein
MHGMSAARRWGIGIVVAEFPRIAPHAPSGGVGMAKRQRIEARCFCT